MLKSLIRQGALIFLFQVVSKFLTLAGGIWTARMLGPEKLGVSGIFLSIMPVFLIFSGLKLEIELIRQHTSDSSQDQLVKSADTFFTFQFLNCLILILFFFPLVWIFTDSDQLSLALVLAIPCAILTGTQAEWILQAKEKLPQVYLANIFLALASTSIIFLVIRKDSPAGIDLLAILAGLLVSWILKWKFAGLKNPIPKWNFERIGYYANVAFKNWAILLTTLFVFLYNHLEAAMVGWLNNVQELGYYRVAQSTSTSLATFITFIPAFLFPKFVKWNQLASTHGKASPIVTIFFLLPIAFIGFYLCLFFGEFLIPLLYSKQFSPAAVPFTIVMGAKLIFTLNMTLTVGFWAEKKNTIPLLIVAPAAILSLILNIIFIPQFGMLAASYIYLVTSLIIFAGLSLAFLNYHPVRPGTISTEP